MTDADELLRQKVQKHLHKTGFPLEMRVAAACWDAGARDVTQSRHYADIDSDTIRETDVVPMWLNTRVMRDFRYVYLVIECKSHAGPWVIFDTNDGETEDAQQRLFWAVTKEHPENAMAQKLVTSMGVYKTLFKPSRLGTGVVEVFKADGAESPGGQSVDKRNPAWDAVRAAVSAAHGMMRDMVAPDDEAAGSMGIVAVPVVVTDGKLFRAYLHQSGEVAVEAIDRGEVLVRPSPLPHQTRCIITTESALARLLADAAATGAVLL